MDGLQISPAVTAELAGYRGKASRPRRPSWFKRHAKLLSFILLVLAPTVATATYLVGFASDQFVSEARFVVRGPASGQSPGLLTGLLQSAGVSRAQDDTYAVQDFILSRDALTALVDKQGLRAVFDRPDADPIARFPNFWTRNTFEHFYKFYQNHVSVLLDTTTGVTELTVRTFSAEDSQRIATALLAAAEDLVNRMNERQRENAIHDALNDVKMAEQRVQAVAADIATFRNREAILDPNKQSVPMLQGITELQTMLSRVNLQITQLQNSSPRSPMISEYQRRASALQGQIEEAKKKITGGDLSLVPKITAYDLLQLQREFADRQLASATSSLETARMSAERQQLYLDLIVHPNLADYAAYPKKVATTAVVFASALGLYFILGLLVAGAREHRII